MSISIARQLLLRTCTFQQICKFTTFPSYSELSWITPSRTFSTNKMTGTADLDEFADEFETNEATGIYSNLDYPAITDNDPEKMHTLKLLLVKLELMSKKGVDLPRNVPVEKWREIMSLSSTSQRIKYLRYLRTTESLKEEKKLEKLERHKLYKKYLDRKKLEPKTIITTSSPPKYGLGHTALFYRIRDAQIENFHNYKLLDPMMNGPDILFDCDFDKFMTKRETSSAAKQIGHAWNLNRMNIKPYNVIFCNLRQENFMLTKLKQLYPRIDDPGYPFNITPKSFLELYPKDQLVYLSPHAVDTLEYYDPNKCYIIGAMVDIVMPEPITLAKAKKYGIQAKRFPLDRYVQWKTGGKSLHMDHVMKIMLDLKNGLDWRTILLKHVPSRKLADEQPETELEENYKIDAQRIRKMYLKNKVHELIVDEQREAV